MVGQTARTMQGTGWLPITSAGFEPPYWSGLWFGVYPTWETLGAQLAAAVFVIGSYFLAQEVRVRRPRRRSAKVARQNALEPAPRQVPARRSTAGVTVDPQSDEHPEPGEYREQREQPAAAGRAT